MYAFAAPMNNLIKLMPWIILLIWKIILFAFLFCLTKKETKKSRLWISIFPPWRTQIIVLKVLISRCVRRGVNFHSFLKLTFFKNVLTEILKIRSFSSVVKTIKFKAENLRLGRAERTLLYWNKPYYSFQGKLSSFRLQ